MHERIDLCAAPKWIYAMIADFWQRKGKIRSFFKDSTSIFSSNLKKSKFSKKGYSCILKFSSVFSRVSSAVYSYESTFYLFKDVVKIFVSFNVIPEPFLGKLTSLRHC